jgi:hypothetical protein
MANKKTNQPAPPAYDKTNTCNVNIITSKKNEKKYSLFVCNIGGIEMTGILNSNEGYLSGELRRNRDSEKRDAVVDIEAVNSRNIDAPAYRGKIKTEKGTIFEIALWEQFGKTKDGKKYHFWSGKVKPEGESGFSEDDGSNPFLKAYADGEQQFEKQYSSATSFTSGTGEGDDLPF